MERPHVKAVLVWDWPVRACHWLLVVAVTGLVITGKVGGNWMEWHARLGFFVLGLVVFRILWGFIGSQTARFAYFVHGPRAVLAYLRDGTSPVAGHTPLGALSVLAMLLVLAIQAVSGLFANDNILLEGPYASLVGKETSDLISRIHDYNSNVLLALIGLHLAAIAFYWVRKRNNLLPAMITGRKTAPDNLKLSMAPPWLAPVLIVAVAAAITVIVGGKWPFR